MKTFRTDQRGALMVEFSIYFPLVMLAFLIFIVSSLIITQRAVVDRAVVNATTHAADWLSGSMPIIGTDPFSGQAVSIRHNPYVEFLAGVFNADRRNFYPFANAAAFSQAVEEHVLATIRQGITGGFAGDVTVSVDYNDFLIAGDLTVTATQRMSFPLGAFLGLDEWAFTATSTARVFYPHFTINTLGFGFDVIRRLTGFEVENMTSNILDVVGNLYRSAVSSFTGGGN